MRTYGRTNAYPCPTCGFDGMSTVIEMARGEQDVKALRCGGKGCGESWEVAVAQQPFLDPAPEDDPNGVLEDPAEVHSP